MVGIKKPAVTTAATIAVRRVVTCFIMTNPSNRIVIFHRCATMPSFPSHWAGISGSIEKIGDGKQQEFEAPYHAAKRELAEETNLYSKEFGEENIHLEEQGGLYLDVPYTSPPRSGRPQQNRVIRVYPFVLRMSDDDVDRFEMRGTEHDDYQFVEYQELVNLEPHCVPGLVQAFHHATYGAFKSELPDEIRRWANDKENGASIMTQNAIQLVNTNDRNRDDDEEQNAARLVKARDIAMLRPSMVPIVNVMNRIIADDGKESVTMESFLHEMDRCVTMGQNAIKNLLLQKLIAIFARSHRCYELRPLADRGHSQRY